ncbi:hypothetical protein ACIHFE_30400 [Streptomyces sp. NPDC052396]|uniref:hypothetical protein n=1 Tax=Streptomyces sp. NPDC052396 TaxID=3365689 RepID=UPI0037D42A78
MPELHEGGQQPVDEDQLVPGPGPDSPLPVPGGKPGLVTLMPQRADLGNEFGDHRRRRPRDPLVPDNRSPDPHHAGATIKEPTRHGQLRTSPLAGHQTVVVLDLLGQGLFGNAGRRTGRCPAMAERVPATTCVS